MLFYSLSDSAITRKTAKTNPKNAFIVNHSRNLIIYDFQFEYMLYSVSIYQNKMRLSFSYLLRVGCIKH